MQGMNSDGTVLLDFNESSSSPNDSSKKFKNEFVVIEDGYDRNPRRRTKTSRFEFDSLDNEEQKILQQALRISRKETKRIKHNVPEAPVYHPTLEQFADPIKYIESIRKTAENYGICKIIPPSEWVPPCQISFSNPKLFPTKLQRINTLREGQGFEDGKYYNLESYKKMADEFKVQWIEGHHSGKDVVSVSELEEDYWRIVETNSENVKVEYGNDLDTIKYSSGFITSSTITEQQNSEVGTSTSSTSPDQKFSKPLFSASDYATSGWNLNNLPHIEGSLLRYLETHVNGVNVPWLYIGMLFSSFCWHNEDNYFNSINYSHMGAVKQWYGVPGTHTKQFEKVSKDFLLELFRDTPDILHHMTTQISPSLLIANGVPVYKIAQEPNTFIVTFPKAYHGGFSTGFNIGEAVNFATPDWLVAGGEAEERYRIFARGSVFSHQRLLFTLLQHKDALPERRRSELAVEIIKIINEEIASRSSILSKGVRDISHLVKLPSNEFEVIDEKAVEYDEMRCCSLCKTACIFSAVACECDRAKVACVRHYNMMCRCPKDRMFMLVWAPTSWLSDIHTELLTMIK